MSHGTDSQGFIFQEAESQWAGMIVCHLSPLKILTGGGKEGMERLRQVKPMIASTCQ